MTSEARRGRRGFTLFEVLAAVLILGLFYTVLADSAVRGLRSEGMDRRRSAAAAIADTQLVELETLLANGAPLQPLYEELEVNEDYLLVTEIAAEDVLALLPPPPLDAPEEPDDLQSLLVDERGESRVYRISVAVRWDEAGEPQEVLRRSWDFDRSQLAQLFPPESDSAGAAGAAGAAGTAGGGEGEGDGGGKRTPSGDTGGAPDDSCANITTLEDLVRCLGPK